MLRLTPAGSIYRMSLETKIGIFIVGVIVGFTSATLLITYKAVQKEVIVNYETIKPVTCPPLNKHTYDLVQRIPDLNASFTRELLHRAEKMHSWRLAQEVRILCWVMTTAANHKEKAFHVKATWGRHCNRLVFISDEDDPELPAIKLDGVRSGREGLWSKTVSAFQYVHDKYRGEYDWVMKADDDTYVFVENLRLMLLPYSSGDPLHFGFHFKPHVPMGYMSGGAGYVLSKEAVDRLIAQFKEGYNNICRGPDNIDAEDLNIGLCLRAVGVLPGDSRDKQGRNRFFPFEPEIHLSPDFQPYSWWFWDYVWWPMAPGGLDCCSDEPISFHYIKPAHMYMTEYLAYHVKPYGVINLQRATDPPRSPSPLTTTL